MFILFLKDFALYLYSQPKLGDETHTQNEGV